MTEYEYEYYSISQKWPNTNTNIIWFPKNDEYYSVSQKWPKTNTNIIQLPINDQIQIRISFPFTIMTEYKYNSASPKWSNSINECKFFEPPKRKASKTSSESHKVMLNSPRLWNMRIICSFGAQSSFGRGENSKNSSKRALTHLFFQRISWSGHQKSESAVTNFHVPIYEWLGPTHQKYQCWAKYV